MTNLEELRGPAFRAFVGLARAWKLTDSEQLLLLGCPSGADFSHWKEGDLATLGVDAITRISLLLGIYSAPFSPIPIRRIPGLGGLTQTANLPAAERWI
jgi:hypothetical protein